MLGDISKLSSKWGTAPSPTTSAGYGAGLSFYSAQAAPSLADISRQQDIGFGKIGTLEANKQYQTGLLNKNYNLQLQGVGLNEQRLGLQRNAAQRSLGSLGQYESIARNLMGLQNKGFDVDTTEANQSADVSRRAAFSDATARGAINTPGFPQALTDISNALANKLARTDIGRQSAAQEFQKTLLGLRDQRANTQDNLKEMDIRAKEYGLTRDQLRNTLDQGLAKLNLDTIMSVDDIMTGLVSGDLQTQQLLNAIVNQALQSAPQFGQALQQGAHVPVSGLPTSTPAVQYRGLY